MGSTLVTACHHSCEDSREETFVQALESLYGHEKTVCGRGNAQTVSDEKTLTELTLSPKLDLIGFGNPAVDR